MNGVFMKKRLIKCLSRLSCAVLICPIIFAAAGCYDKPLLTELKKNSLKVILKGTYESNSPRGWLSPVFNTYCVDDSIDDYPVTISDLPETFMIDLAGMSMSGGGKGKSDFSNYRQTFSFSVGEESSSFFNGDGVLLENDDVEPGRDYTSLKLYLRKLLFSDSMKYELTSSSWTDGEEFKTYFEEEKVYAFNFNLLQVNYLYDTLKEDGDYTNRIFPMNVDISNGLNFDVDEGAVLEIRILVKNFIKLYEYDNLDYTSDEPYVAHYFAFSDWLRDVKSDENIIGGNMLVVARTYVEGKTGTISGSIGSAGYVIAVPAGSSINEYTSSGTLRSDKLTYCDRPSKPDSASDNMPALLNYYMKLEKYKYDYNAFLERTNVNATGDPQDLYEEEWEDYNDTADSFKIPPLATYTSDGSYNLTNIAPGSYDLYYSNTLPDWGKLFSSFTLLKSGQQVNSGDSLTVNKS